MVKDGLVEIHKDSILLTEVGQDFTQTIMNVLINMIHLINLIKRD